jgi:hypothetical protein
MAARSSLRMQLWLDITCKRLKKAARMITGIAYHNIFCIANLARSTNNCAWYENLDPFYRVCMLDHGISKTIDHLLLISLHHIAIATTLVVLLWHLFPSLC